MNRRNVLLLVGLVVAVMAAVVVIALIGFGGSGIGSGYLASGSRSVIFLQWTVNGTHVAGTAREDAFSGSPPTETLSSTTVSVNGQVQGSKISLSFNGHTPVFGTFTGSTFTIGVPQTNGTLASATFHAASVTDFNSAVVTLRGRMNSANRIAAAQQRAQQQAVAAAQKAQQEQEAVTTAAATVKEDLSSLSKTVGELQTVLQMMASGLTSEKGALAKVEASEAAEQSKVNSGTRTTVCYVARSTVAYEANSTVEYAARSTVTYEANILKGDFGTVEKGISSLQAAFSGLQSTEAAIPTYHPSTVPSQATVTAAIAAANKAISGDAAQANSYIGQANQYVTQAYQIVGTAYQIGGCGTPPAAPATQPTITG